MERKIIKRLLEWKELKDNKRQPLILLGARQVGKTYIIQDFGTKYYKNTVYLNFEQNPDLKSIFDGELTPKSIIRLIEIATRQTIQENDTLLFFDEIQLCERALTSLKYFCEEAKNFHIIAAGSLLGVAINREKYSFPVGKVLMETLKPLDFEEFLTAMGQKELIDEIKICYKSNKPLVEILHKQALELYRTYLCTGGMPAVVMEYSVSQTFLKISEIQNNILNAYVADMAKYAEASETVKIRTAFDSIPAQLSKENHKFQYKLIKKGASASYFGVAIDWLCNSNVVARCRRIEHGKMPPSAFVDLSAFKIYMADTGLLRAKSGLPFDNILFKNNNSNDFNGALAENYVAQALWTNEHEIFYWESDSRAEIDFISTIGSDVIPIEVKSATNNRSKSLAVYISKYKPPYAIRISANNFGFENNIKSVPLYAVFLIHK